jgi:hypothetical protein
MPIEFPLGGGSSGGSPVVSATVDNNSTSSVATLDKNAVLSAMYYYSIYRKSDSDPEAVRSGIIFATHKTDSDVWVLLDILDGFDDPDSVGVTFSINSSTGEISYTSSNYSATGYESSLKIQQISELTQ